LVNGRYKKANAEHACAETQHKQHDCGARAEYNEQQNNADAMFEMMQIMPHSVQASMITSGDTAMQVWALCEKNT
jgi:hypothetical protein